MPEGRENVMKKGMKTKAKIKMKMKQVRTDLW